MNIADFFNAASGRILYFSFVLYQLVVAQCRGIEYALECDALSFRRSALQSSRVQETVGRIDTAVDEGRISFPLKQIEAEAELSYFQACLQETLRL